MTRRFHIAGFLGLALLVGVPRARGAEAAPIRLRYSAPQTCPDAAAFMDQVSARTPLARAARGDEPATELRVVVQEVPGGSSGKLELHNADATIALREVSAVDCAQVVSALALMTALAIDPNASTAVAQPPQPAPPPPPTMTTPARSAQPPRPALPPPARWAFEVGAVAEALGGVAPDPVLLVRPFVELVHELDSSWGYALRLSGSRAQAEAANSLGRADFTLWSGRVEPCPLRVSLARAFAFSACIPVDVGRLEAVGRGLSPSERVARPWLSIGGSGRIEWQPVGVLVLEAAGELFFPIVRDRFFVGADATLHRAPAVAAGASLGAGARFP